MSVINADTAAAWRQIAANVSRQRPYPGRRCVVLRGRTLFGETVAVVRHMRDQFDRGAFRYGGAGNLHMREMAGRSGYVCLVRTDDGRQQWVKARYLMCIDANYPTWAHALSDALCMSV